MGVLLLLSASCARDFSLPPPRPQEPPPNPALTLEDTEAFAEEMVLIRAEPPPGGIAEVLFGGVAAEAVEAVPGGWRARVPLAAPSGTLTVRGAGWSANPPQPFRYLGAGHHIGYPVPEILAAPAGPGGVAVGGGVVAVVLEDLGALGLFRLLDRRPVAPPHRPGVVGDPQAAPDAARIAYLAEGGRRLVVLEFTSEVLATTAAEVCALDLGEPAGGVALGPAGTALVLHPATRRVRSVQAAPPCSLGSALDLDLGLARAAFGAGNTALAWGAETSDLVLLEATAPAVLVRARTAGEVRDAIYDPSRGSFLVVEEAAVSELDGASLELLGSAAVASAARGALDSAGHLWLTHPERGTLTVLDDLRAKDSIPVGGTPLGAAAAGETVVVADRAARALRGLSASGRGAEVWRAPLLAGLGGAAVIGERAVAASIREPALFAWGRGARAAHHVGGVPLGPVAALGDGRVAALVAGPAGSRLLALDLDGGSAELVGALEGSLAALAVGPGDELAAAAEAGGQARAVLFAPGRGLWSRREIPLPGAPRALSALGAGRFLASLPSAQSVAELRAGAPAALEALPFAPGALSFSARTGSYAAAEEDAPRLWLWKSGAAPLEVPLPGPVDWPEGLAHSPDGAYLYAAVTSRDLVAMVSVAEARVIKIFTTAPAPRGLASSADGKRLFIASEAVPDLYAVE